MGITKKTIGVRVTALKSYLCHHLGPYNTNPYKLYKTGFTQTNTLTSQRGVPLTLNPITGKDLLEDITEELGVPGRATSQDGMKLVFRVYLKGSKDPNNAVPLKWL